MRVVYYLGRERPVLYDQRPSVGSAEATVVLSVRGLEFKASWFEFSPKLERPLWVRLSERSCPSYVLGRSRLEDRSSRRTVMSLTEFYTLSTRKISFNKYNTLESLVRL